MRIIALLVASLISGLCWEIGTNLGLIFNIALRPASLALLVFILWSKAKPKWKACIVVGAILISNVIARLTYMLQTGPWYVLSDRETQLWLVILVIIQIGVSLAVLFIGSRIKKKRMLNQRVEPTTHSMKNILKRLIWFGAQILISVGIATACILIYYLATGSWNEFGTTPRVGFKTFYVDLVSPLVFSRYSADWLPVASRLSLSTILLFIFWKKPKKSLAAEAIMSVLIGGFTCYILIHVFNHGLL